MELYKLDHLLRRIEVIDTFESLIWTERWQEIGDFELRIQSTQANRNLFLVNTRLAMSESDRVMVVEDVEDSVEEEGEVLLVTGRSVERILDERVLKESLSSSDNWYVTTSPWGLPQFIFDHIFGHPKNPWAPEPQLHPDDGEPLLRRRGVSLGTMQGEEEGLTGVIDWIQETPDTLYNELRKHCISWDLGFRIVLAKSQELDLGNLGEPFLYFESYAGRDKTTLQTENTPVIFTVDRDSLQESREFVTVKDYKTVAYVFTELGQYRIVTLAGATANSGLKRRILLINTQVPDDWTGTVAAYLNKVGRDALRAQSRRGISIFEGQINQNSEYKYGTNYRLGDVVEVRNRDGVVAYKHVTEQIFVADQEGERSYPTLSIGRFEPPNTWRYYEEGEWVDAGQTTWETA